MLSVRNRGDPKLPYPIRSLWMPMWDMAGGVYPPRSYWRDEYNRHVMQSPRDSTVMRMEMTRIAIGLRLWLRRAIKRINDRTTARIVDMVNWNSLRALYGR